MKKISLYITAIIVTFAVAWFVLPSAYEIERTVLIKASPKVIYSKVVNLRTWSHWAVWFQRDPNIEINYSGPDRAIGMHSNWSSKSLGDGEIEIIDLQYNQQVTYELNFAKSNSSSSGVITIEPIGELTRVTWTDTSELSDDPVSRLKGLLNEDNLGKDYEVGLQNLKTISEHRI